MATFRTIGTCAREIIFNVDDNNTLTMCKFINGCSGNAQGIVKLALGNDIDIIIEKLKGIQCKQNTSCPDQLAKALVKYKEDLVAKEEAAKLKEQQLKEKAAATTPAEQEA